MVNKSQFFSSPSFRNASLRSLPMLGTGTLKPLDWDDVTCNATFLGVDSLTSIWESLTWLLVPAAEEHDFWFWETAFRTVLLEPECPIPVSSCMADFLVEVISECCRGEEAVERSLTDLWWRGLQLCIGWFDCPLDLAGILGARRWLVVEFCSKFAGDWECFSCWQTWFCVSSFRRPNLQRASTLTFSGFINLSTVTSAEQGMVESILGLEASSWFIGTLCGVFILGLGATGGGVGLEPLLVTACEFWVRIWDPELLPTRSLFVETCCSWVLASVALVFRIDALLRRCTRASYERGPRLATFSGRSLFCCSSAVSLLPLILCGGGITTTLTSEGTRGASWWSWAFFEATLGAVFFWDAANPGLVWICELRCARTNGVGTI